MSKLDVVIPVLNEAHVLEGSVAKVRNFLSQNLDHDWRIVIIDNGSTDGTEKVGKKLSAEFHDVEFIHLPQKGRGLALRSAWLKSTADIVCYTDVDLSTDLKFLPLLISAIAKDNYDLAIGSRMMKGSYTKRSFKREIISRIYNIFVKAILFTRFSDAQCGFKAVTREAVEKIVPQIKDQSWFFDTELLVLAEKQGYRIKDIPVVWIEDDDSRVKILRTAWDDMKGVFRLRRQLWKSSFVHEPVREAKRQKT
jgi:glycosyltransferase involved in cell wall biosynthesis